MKVIDLCANEVVRMKMEDVFEYDGYCWKGFYNKLLDCSLDRINFKYEDIDRNVFVLDDGGDLIRLKDGRYMNVCWRGDVCRVWKEDEYMCKRYDMVFNKEISLDELYEDED